MDEQSKAKLDEIVAKEPAALTDSEREFLRARRSYLSSEQTERYEEVLNAAPSEEEKAKYAQEPEDRDTVEARTKAKLLGEEQPKDEQPEAKPFSKMNKAELQAECTARNIEFDAAATNAELTALLEESKANEEPVSYSGFHLNKKSRQASISLWLLIL